VGDVFWALVIDLDVGERFKDSGSASQVCPA
jgi:hypothetical protein